MGVKVIHLNNEDNALNTSNDHISLTSIEIFPSPEDDGQTIIVDEGVKRTLTIKYDAHGNPEPSTNILGMQYDNRVTWLKVDLDELLWHVYGEPYDDESKYDRYIFKWHFSSTALEESETWVFDPIDRFEIPRDVTNNPGRYSITLTIQENIEANKNPTINWPGNVKDEEEIFVAAPWIGIVEKSIIYRPDLDIQVYQRETDQLKALTKPAIEGTLTDEGGLKFNTNILGRRGDRFITYIKFNPQLITQHLKEFTLIAAFKSATNTDIYYSLFEQVKADDVFDDVTESYPIIAWIPPAVTRIGGRWQVCILAFAGDVSVAEPNLEDYYFYVSRSQLMIVNDSKISDYDLVKDPKELLIPASDTEFFYTSTNEGFYTSLGKILRTRAVSRI